MHAHRGGVVDICDPVKRDWVLRSTDVDEVWDVGRRMEAYLETMNIKIAMYLAKADRSTFRQNFSVVIEKITSKLTCTWCLGLASFS